MNVTGLLKAFDAVVMLRDAAKRIRGPRDGTMTSPDARSAGLIGQVEARLTGVVVAALKEAFDRDHARLELERMNLEEQRRRAEEALRLELRRQTAERDLGRLRLLAGTALVGWLASVLALGTRIAGTSMPSRAILAAGWVLLLCALGSAFVAQGRVNAYAADGSKGYAAGQPGTAALWLLIGGLALTAFSLLV